MIKRSMATEVECGFTRDSRPASRPPTFQAPILSIRKFHEVFSSRIFDTERSSWKKHGRKPKTRPPEGGVRQPGATKATILFVESARFSASWLAGRATDSALWWAHLTPRWGPLETRLVLRGLIPPLTDFKMMMHGGAGCFMLAGPIWGGKVVFA